MKQVRTIKELRSLIQDAKQDGKRIGFVPTMGYLHEGHLALVNEARKNTDVVVMSIFVNPLQFGEGEDFETYPRSEERDREMAEDKGVDILFLPDAEEMYPRPMRSAVNILQGTDVMCGASRPGHFNGVATVVLKLFNMVNPDAAFFGQKDAQQVAVIENMVKDFNMNIEIFPAPIVREKDGLAMSSRNINLSPAERKEAPEIYKILQQAAALIRNGKADTAMKEASEKLYALKAEVDYLELRTFPDLGKSDGTDVGKIILAAAVKYEKVRLIDNIIWEQ
jgi:pantoate--beta-alanine ligase